MKKKLPHTRLAEGEVTGHYHEAVGEGCVLYDDWTLDAPKGCEVTHQEHDVIKIPEGEYERSIVQEFDHAEEEAREVID